MRGYLGCASLALSLLGLVGCKDPPGKDDGTCGDVGCNCTPGTCGPGLECAPYGICIPPSGDGDGDGDGESDEGDPPDVNKDDDGGTCDPGNYGCDCDDGQCYFDPMIGDLECKNDKCVKDICPDGDQSCECKDGAGCDAGLNCVDGFCLNIEDECIQPYNKCYDNIDGYPDEECCLGTLCIGYEPENSWGCATTCSAHSDCATDCCVNIQGETQTYCSPSASFCGDFGKCIDTCLFNDDGDCDDGGPGSDYDLCELGTDCADCGTRF